MFRKIALCFVFATVLFCFLSSCEGHRFGRHGRTTRQMTGTFHEIKNRARPTLSRRVVNFGNSIRQKSTDHAKKLIDMVIPSSSPVNCPQVRCALGLSQNCVIIQVDTKKKNGCPEYPCGKKICGPDGTSHFSQPKLTDKLKLDKWEDCVGGAEQACNSLCGAGNVDYEEESRKKC